MDAGSVKELAISERAGRRETRAVCRGWEFAILKRHTSCSRGGARRCVSRAGAGVFEKRPNIAVRHKPHVGSFYEDDFRRRVLRAWMNFKQVQVAMKFYQSFVKLQHFNTQISFLPTCVVLAWVPTFLKNLNSIARIFRGPTGTYMANTVKFQILRNAIEELWWAWGRELENWGALEGRLRRLFNPSQAENVKGATILVACRALWRNAHLET